MTEKRKYNLAGNKSEFQNDRQNYKTFEHIACIGIGGHGGVLSNL